MCEVYLLICSLILRCHVHLCIFKVQKKCKEALSTGVEWEKIVREVLTDVMLEVEGLEPTAALVYIFKQEFTFFPVSL